MAIRTRLAAASRREVDPARVLKRALNLVALVERRFNVSPPLTDDELSHIGRSFESLCWAGLGQSVIGPPASLRGRVRERLAKNPDSSTLTEIFETVCGTLIDLRCAVEGGNRKGLRYFRTYMIEGMREFVTVMLLAFALLATRNHAGDRKTARRALVVAEDLRTLTLMSFSK